METSKICTKCHTSKTLDEFTIRTDTGNHRRQCKDCVIERHKKYYCKNKDKSKKYQEKNKEKIREYRRKKYLENSEEIKEERRQYRKENKELVKAQKKKYYEKHSDYVKQKTKDYYAENTEAIAIKNKEYRDKHFEVLKEKKKIYISENLVLVRGRQRRYMQTPKGRAIAKNMKHMRRTAEKNGDVTTVQLLELQQNEKVCYWCDKQLIPEQTHVDHYMPLSKGGKHTISNLVMACSKCNRIKSNKDPLKFAAEIGKIL